MKIGFILTTFSRIDDFLAHLDILKYFPRPYEVIPIWMNRKVPDYFMEEMNNYKHAHFCNGLRFSIGPLLGLISGIKKAHKIGLDYVIYRNGDDWLFNREFVLENIKNTKVISAYNWFGINYKREFALNEMCLHVPSFMKTIDWAEKYFLDSNDKLLCEFKVAKWIRKTTKEFYRLPFREIYFGIGNDPLIIAKILESKGFTVNDPFFDLFKDNNRYFNRKWQLLGCHDNKERLKLYKELFFPYKEQLEKEKHFSRWLKDEPWNLQINKFTHLESRDIQPKHIPLKIITVQE